MRANWRGVATVTVPPAGKISLRKTSRLYTRRMLPWSEVIDPMAAQNGFAGVVSVDRGGEIEFARAYGLAHRAHQIPNTVGTRFAIASGSKGLTAPTVVSLINDKALSMSTTARSVLGADLPLIGGDVTIEHPLAHRSGIGDYLDEEAGHEITDYVLAVPTQDLAATEQYLTVLNGHPAKFPAGRTCSTCRSWAAGMAESTLRPRTSPPPGCRCLPEGSFLSAG